MCATPGYPLSLDWLPAALERDARRDAAAVPHHRPHRRHRQQPRHRPLDQVSVQFLGTGGSWSQHFFRSRHSRQALDIEFPRKCLFEAFCRHSLRIKYKYRHHFKREELIYLCNHYH